MPASLVQDWDKKYIELKDVLENEGLLAGTKPVSHRPEEVRVNCPFCQDTKHHMYCNLEKNLFHCFKCKEQGGTILFLARLNNKEPQDILDKLRATRVGKPSLARKKKNKQLSYFQLKKAGFHNPGIFSKTGLNWRAKNPGYLEREQNWKLQEWKEELDHRKRWGLITLLNYKKAGLRDKAILALDNYNKELGEDIKSAVLQVESQLKAGINPQSLPEWALPPYPEL